MLRSVEFPSLSALKGGEFILNVTGRAGLCSGRYVNRHWRGIVWDESGFETQIGINFGGVEC